MRLSLDEARAAAAGAAVPLPARSLPLDQALGARLAEDLVAAADLPAWDTSAMDGWAVAGVDGPWRVVGTALAGTPPPRLHPATAVVIATGARLPAGTTGVLRHEQGRVLDDQLLHGAAVLSGQDTRPAGEECRVGDVVAVVGELVTPPLLGLAAALGADELPVVPHPTVDLLVLGDELTTAGRPGDGQVRDALGPMLPAWLADLGGRCRPPTRLPDTHDDLAAAVRRSTADLVVTTGSTARGPVDHLHAVLEEAGARLVVDGVAVRPGHPMLLARLADGRPLAGLPGNPLAAVSGLLTLVAPVLAALRADPPAPLPSARLAGSVTTHPHDVRLIPVVREAATPDRVRPLHHTGPAMLRGLALADALAVVRPGGGAPGTAVSLLAVPGRRSA